MNGQKIGYYLQRAQGIYDKALSFQQNIVTKIKIQYCNEYDKHELFRLLNQSKLTFARILFSTLLYTRYIFRK